MPFTVSCPFCGARALSSVPKGQQDTCSHCRQAFDPFRAFEAARPIVEPLETFAFEEDRAPRRESRRPTIGDGVRLGFGAYFGFALAGCLVAVVVGAILVVMFFFGYAWLSKPPVRSTNAQPAVSAETQNSRPFARAKPFPKSFSLDDRRFDG